jgi:hypothetical protein
MPMGAPNVGTVFDSYRDVVAELVEDGVPFDRVESLIDEVTYLPEDSRAALWLMAFTRSGAMERRNG